jgi:hypothetical protein
MLNQTFSGPETELKIHPHMANADWCVGDAPARWDVSFTDRLWFTVRRWFARETTPTRPVMRVTTPVELERRAAA